MPILRQISSATTGALEAATHQEGLLLEISQSFFLSFTLTDWVLGSPPSACS